ncbi:MAG: protein kinase [Candidatus Aminicenantes bacterium]|nr:protein kinase [Candidatus Aminicenantes bacterium]NIM80765.1 protein kinase [Candidatus Aminicenantes bacterium]NIN20148.1 protein kinase [Candidatus Aminicenantes bacterium]NIN43927.1 protein kinase [Candidatus Aminicenantes bacterium]NIN86736.1 protein kinase [Candidatus Aminicenantes bacterium]
MQQCSQCKRFLSDKVGACRYCGSSHLEAKPITMGQDEELVNYKIFAENIYIGAETYRIIDAVGQGGHGVVLRVESPNGNYYALKAPLEFNELFTNSQGNKKSLLNMSRRYIAHEVDMLSKITSEALLEIVYAGKVVVKCSRNDREIESEFPAILLELAEGTLKDVMDNEMANLLVVPYEEKINMIKQLTANLELLHQKIVVHRDISPHNVFIVDRENEIRYVLGDFGTSKPANVYDIHNSTTRMAFHDRYLDPAVFMYDKFRYDCRIDIYQLGVMITEILLGEYWMTEDEDTAGTGIQGLDFEKDFLMNFALHEIDPVLIEKIRKATTLKINNRYRSAGEFRKEVHEALECVQNAHKKKKKIKSREGLKKNISISYKRIIQFNQWEHGKNEEMTTAVNYNGQKKIDMGTADHLQIRFTGLELTKARIIGASFLTCHKKDNSIFLQVDREDIGKRVRPLLQPGIMNAVIHFLVSLFNPKRPNKSQGHLRVEFDCKSILYIEGIRCKEK